MFERQSRADFSRARRKAFWQKVRSWFSGQTDALLPYDQVREAIPIQGQRYRGLQAIPIRQIVGSVGRYHDFNRAFLPTQDHTQGRWINIDKAHYEEVALPPIDVYKVGDVYFVKDGNHRVSVARERGMVYIDAFVTEIDIPVSLTPQTDVSDLEKKRETALFLEKTGLLMQFPDASIELTLPGEVERLFEHIDTHQYYLGLEAGETPDYPEAVRSWYTNVYEPLVKEIRRQDLGRRFKNLTDADLYLLVSEYQWLLREVYADEISLVEANNRFTESLQKISPEAAAPAERIKRSLQNAPWLDEFILNQERDDFFETTGLALNASIPGAYTKLFQHINDHRWYLGIDANREIPWSEAANSWFEKVYTPLADLIDDLDILRYFPGRSKTDLYLWIMEHHAGLSESLDWDITLEEAAQSLVRSAAPDAEVENENSSAEVPNPLLFSKILVPIGDSEDDFPALDQALVIAERNMGRIYGLHVISPGDPEDEPAHMSLADRFSKRCEARGIPGRLAFENGPVAQKITERAEWADLIVLKLRFPPAASGLSKMASGMRHVLRRGGRPVLAVPGAPTQMKKVLLAYNGSPLADDALFTAAVLAAFWEETDLTVLSAGPKKSAAKQVLTRAREFLEAHHIVATYQSSKAPAHAAILELAEESGSDLILLGGYGSAPLIEITFGSTLDLVLQDSRVPVLIRT